MFSKQNARNKGFSDLRLLPTRNLNLYLNLIPPHFEMVLNYVSMSLRVSLVKGVFRNFAELY